MADYGLGTVRGVIEFEYNGERVVARVVEDQERIRDSGYGADQALRDAGRGAAVGGAAIVGALGLAVRSASNFEFSMSAIQAVSGATADEMQQISDKALQIGADTSFSAGEAATAIEELVKAGIAIPDVMNGAADATVALAAAGQIELPEAAAISAAALNQFKLGAEDLTGVADLLAGAANASATGVSEIGSALTYVGPVAQAAGVSIDDTAAAIALLANNGIDGSKAGTVLRSILSNLQPVTERQTEAFRELGLITEDGTNAFYNADGSLKDMRDIVDILSTAFGPLTEAQKLAYAEAMFGQEALAGVTAIAGTGAQGFDDLTASIESISAADVAATRLDNTKGSIEALMGSVETLAISIGDKLLPAVNSVVQKVISAVNWFGELDGSTQQTIATVAGVTGGLLLAFAALTKIIASVQTAAAVWKVFAASQVAAKIATAASTVATGIATAAQWAWNAALTANPIGLIIAAIAALVGALVWFFTQTETGKKIWAAVWGAIQTAVQAVVAWFTQTVVPFFQQLWGYITTGWDAMVNVWNTIYNTVASVVEWIWNALVTYVAFWQGVVQGFVDWITAAWDGFWNGPFGQVIQAAWNAVLAIIQFVITLIQVIIYQTVQAIQWVWENVWGRIRDFVVNIWNAVYDWIATKIAQAQAIIAAVVDAIRSRWEAIWNAISSFVSGVWNAIYNYISSKIQQARDIVSSVVGSIQSTVSSIFNSIKSTVTSIWDGIYNAIKTPIENAYNWLKDKIEAIGEIFSGAKDMLWDAAIDIMTGFLDGLKSMWDDVAGFFSDLTDSITGWKGPEQRDKVLLKPNAVWVMDSFIDTLKDKIPEVQAVLGGLTGAMPEMLGSPVLAVADSATRTAGPASAAALAAASETIANTTNNGAPVIGEITWVAAPDSSIDAKSQLLSMLGRTATVVQLEKIGGTR